jgi:hypothetical protein
MAKMGGERPPASFEAWDFCPGRVFEQQVLHRFGTSVHHPSSSPIGSFFLLAVFRRSSFRLTEDSVGMALHSVLGGSPSGYHIGCVRPCHFRFSVASREVGFLIAAKRRITTEFFDVYFYLWRNGGASWQLELKRWEEEEAAWTLVSRKKKTSSSRHVHFASPIRQPSPRFKSVPSLNHNVRIGDVVCPIEKEPSPWLKPCLSQDQASIPINRVFESIRSRLANPSFTPNNHIKNPALSPSLIPNSNSNLGHEESAYNPPKDFAVNSASLLSSPNEEGQTSRPPTAHCPTDSYDSFHKEQPTGRKGNFLKDSLPAGSISKATQGCFQCLEAGHWARQCRNPIRCRHCFAYGHIERQCQKKKVA